MVTRIFGIGEIVLDVIMREGKPLAGVPGGSTFNAMVSLGRTCGEYEIYMISQLGDDKVADIVVNFMSENRILTKYIERRKDCQSTLSLAILDENNDAQYEFFRDDSMPKFTVQEDIKFRQHDVVIFGSFFAVSPQTRTEVNKLIHRAKQANALVYYDLNFRKSHMLQLADVNSSIEKNMSISNIVRASLEDIYNVYGTYDTDFVYEKYISKFCKTFICTRGAGTISLYISQAEKYDFYTEKIKTISTIGAGDSFNAGFVYALLKNNNVISNFNYLISTASKFSANVCRSLFNYVDKDFLP